MPEIKPVIEPTKIRMIRADITKLTDVDAIVNAANTSIKANPGALDLVEWALFDDDTLRVYTEALRELEK